MRTVIKNFERQELFNLYNSKVNPFSFVTTKLDITKAYNYSRKHKNLYAVLCYTFAVAMNKVENFKYRYEDGEIVKYDVINPVYTEMLDSKDVSFIGCRLGSSLEEFIELNKEAKEKFKETQNEVRVQDKEEGEIWFSCVPWFKFTGVVTPYDSSITIPNIIWDKYEIVDGHVYVNAMIQSHHGFVDGYHIGKLIEYINEELNNISED